jgi:hypothetical protein
MTKLLDDEIEQDELFWNQDALMEVLIFALSLTLNLLPIVYSTFC